jgi:MFS family permease
VLLVSLVVEGIGIAALATVHSTLTALAVMFVYGLGQAAGWPTWNALLGAMIDDDKVSRLAFARNFQLLNLGLGIGAVIGGLVVHVHAPGTFVAVYLIDGTSNLVVVAALALLPRRAFGPDRRGATRSAAGRGSGETAIGAQAVHSGYRAVLSDDLFRRYALTTTVLMLAGYAAVDTGFVGFATTVVKAGPGTIAAAFAANTAFIVLAQPVALRLVARVKRTTALKMVAASFAASWVVLGLAHLVHGSGAARALVIATPVVFAVGEVLLSPVSGPPVNDLAPPALRGRYFAASSECFSVASIVSPAISGAAIGAGRGVALLGLFVICCAATVVGAHWLGLGLTPTQDNAAGSRAWTANQAQGA